MTRLNPTVRSRVFISYSHKDRRHLERLHVHLKQYESKGLVDYWDDTHLPPGADWRQEISEAIRQARVAILLVSADFLASEFIVKEELPPLLAAAEHEGVLIVSVLLSPSAFDRSPLARYQAANDPSRPLIKMDRAGKEALWKTVAENVEDALTSSQVERTPTGEGDPKSPHAVYISTDELRSMAATLLSEKQYERVLPLLETVAQRMPTDVKTWLELSSVYGHLNRWEDKLSAAERALSVEPLSADAMSAKAKALFWLGHEEEAHAVENRGHTLLVTGKTLKLDVHFGGRPSQLAIQGHGQFILIAARAGSIQDWMIDVVREILADVLHYSQWLTDREYLMLRGVWFDDKHGNLTIYVDLIHDQSIHSTLSENELNELLHDGMGWYGSQGVSVEPRIIEKWIYSDGFFSTADEYYADVRRALFWK